MRIDIKTIHSNSINYLFVFYAFVVPTSRAGIVLSTALLIIFWLAEGNFTKKFKDLLKNPITMLLLLFILYNILSVFWCNSFVDAMEYIRKYWYLSVIFIMHSSLKKEYIKHMVNAFLLGMFISEVISYGIFFEWWKFKEVTVEFPTPFMHHIHYSMFLAFTALLLLNRAFIEKILIYKAGYIIYFIFVSTNLFINGGRTGQVAFIITLFIVGILNMKNKIKSIFLMLSLTLFILFLGYSFSPNFQNRVNDTRVDASKVFEQKDFCDSFGRRVGAWIVATEIIEDNPIVGVGVSDAMTKLQSYIKKSHPDKVCVLDIPHFHNDLIQIFVQLGLIGAFIYLALLYKVLTINIKELEYRNLTIIFIITYFISSMFENLLHQQFTMSLFALFIGIFATLKRIEDEIQNSK